METAAALTVGRRSKYIKGQQLALAPMCVTAGCHSTVCPLSARPSGLHQYAVGSLGASRSLSCTGIRHAGEATCPAAVRPILDVLNFTSYETQHVKKSSPC